MYFPDPNYSILRPFSNLSDLYIWNYYFGEELKHGPSYDYEIVTQGIVLSINSLPKFREIDSRFLFTSFWK